jgi:hypothetical protein
LIPNFYLQGYDAQISTLKAEKDKLTTEVAELKEKLDQRIKGPML